MTAPTPDLPALDDVGLHTWEMVCLDRRWYCQSRLPARQLDRHRPRARHSQTRHDRARSPRHRGTWLVAP
jgi:hypothetical protein